MPIATTVKTTAKHNTKKEKAIRNKVEDTIKGEGLAAVAPSELTAGQKAIWKWLYSHLKPVNVLSGLDKITLVNACIIIDRLQTIDNTIEGIDFNTENISVLQKFTNLRNTYFNQYLKVCSELCLSPQARAKMGTLAVSLNKDNTDPLMNILSGDDANDG